MRIALILLVALAACPAAEPVEMGFSFGIVPMDDSSSAIHCQLAGGELEVTRVNTDEPLYKKSLSASERERIGNVFVASTPGSWSGFYHQSMLGGTMLVFKAAHPKGAFEFEGADGCPPGFAKLVAIINSLAGLPLIEGDWEANAKNCRRFEDVGNLFENTENVTKILIEEHRKARREEASSCVPDP